MQTLIALYLQNPAMIWLAVGAVFVILAQATGFGRLMHPAIGAALAGALCALGVHLGLVGEILLVAAATALITGGVFLMRRRSAPAPVVATPQEPPLPFVRRSPPPPAPRAGRGVDADRADEQPRRRVAGL